jgi:alpha-N-arabinofuranosidase
LPVEVGGNSPQHDVKGTVAVDKGARPSGSPTYPLDVFAAISADHKKLEVSVVNPTETAQDCELNLAGVRVAATAKVWRITAPSGPTPVPARAGGLLSGPAATMTETTFEQMPRTITLPPASINVYEFEIRQ